MAYLFFVLAALALATAMWLCVRRQPTPAVPRAWATWHLTRATLAVISSTVGALLVLLGLGRLL